MRDIVPPIIATTEWGIFVEFFPVKFNDWKQCPGMRIFLCLMAKKSEEKSSHGMGEKNGEKPKIQITESVKIAIHSTVFPVGESLFPNLNSI